LKLDTTINHEDHPISAAVAQNLLEETRKFQIVMKTAVPGLVRMK